MIIEHFIVNTLVDLFRHVLLEAKKKISNSPKNFSISSLLFYFPDPSYKYIFICFLHACFFLTSSNICTITNKNPWNWRFTEVTYCLKCWKLTNILFECVDISLMHEYMLSFVPPIPCSFKFSSSNAVRVFILFTSNNIYPRNCILFCCFFFIDVRFLRGKTWHISDFRH